MVYVAFRSGALSGSLEISRILGQPPPVTSDDKGEGRGGEERKKKEHCGKCVSPPVT